MTLFNAKPFDAIKAHSIEKWGGHAMLAGNLVLLASGGVGSSWHQVTGAATFIGTSMIYSQLGDKDGWFAAASLICIPGMVVTNYPELATPVTTTVLGTGLFSVGLLFGAATTPLMRRFSQAGSWLVRHTLGNPRLMMAALSIAADALLLPGALVKSDVGFIAAIGLWMLGNTAFGLSKRPKRVAAATTAPDSPPLK